MTQKKKRSHLPLLMGIGMIVGYLAGWWLHAALGVEAAQQTQLYFAFDGLARLFLDLLKMVVVPLVFFSLLSGMLGMGDVTRLGRLGRKTFLLYIVTSLIATITGLVWVNVLRPGVGFPAEIPTEAVDKPVPGSVWDVLVDMVPSNFAEALANFDLFGIIFFTLFFGAFVLQLPRERQKPLTDIIDAGAEVMLKMTEFIIRLAPIGVGALIARLIVDTGPKIILGLWPYALTVFLALMTQFFVTVPVLIRLRTGRNPYKFMAKMVPAYLTALSTASSSGTLGVTMDCAEKKAGISKRVTSFVLPLGATINMDGTALYEIVTVLFIAQIHAGVDPNFSLGIGQQLLIVFLGFTVSIGAAGIPHAGLVMMVIILQAVGLPPEYTALIWGIDRPLDMMRTAVNVGGDAAVSLIVADGEGEVSEVAEAA